MKIKQQVEEILRDFPQTRDNDRSLVAYLWCTFYSHLLIKPTEKHGWQLPIEKIFELPSYDLITRIRRKIQESGQYPATNPVIIERRRKKEKKIHDGINSQQWEKSLE